MIYMPHLSRILKTFMIMW